VIRRSIEIVTSSFKMALQELWKNKLRTFLSLFGITIGIFCIIGVLAVVGSLERNIQNEVQSLGTNTIYIDKWEYGGGPDKPFWKIKARPTMKYNEAGMLKQLSSLLEDNAFLMRCRGNISYKSDVINNASVYGIGESQIKIQPLFFSSGR